MGVVVDSKGDITGVVSERDYVAKIALLGRTSKETTIKEIATRSSNLVTARTDESIDSCMHKMLSKDIRHLPMVDKNGKVVGLILHLERVLTTGQSRFFTFFGVKYSFLNC